MAASGLATLRRWAQDENASLPTLDYAAAAMVKVLPTRLRDPAASVGFAQRLVSLTHGKKPNFLLALAQACHAAGRPAQGQAAAREGLALLPTHPPGAVRSRIRRLLELAERQGG
jgi:hypothetical protein